MIDLKVQIVQRDGVVEFKFAPHPSVSTGIDRLTQLVSKLLLTKAGSDVFFPKIGGGVDNLLPSVQGADRSLEARVGSIVKNVESQIQEIQAAQRLPPEEKLRLLNLRQAVFDASSGEIKIDVDVISEATTRPLSLVV